MLTFEKRTRRLRRVRAHGPQGNEHHRFIRIELATSPQSGAYNGLPREVKK